MRLPFKRVWHPYEKWEEIHFNMWGTVVDRKDFLRRAIEFTGNHTLYGSYMMRVVKGWPISCENALTDNTLNKRAWIGHAACSLYMRCPEDITRKAWAFLTNEQQLLANKEARRAIQEWADHYRKGGGVYKGLEDKMLL